MSRHIESFHKNKLREWKKSLEKKSKDAQSHIEERLLIAVESGRIPLNAALTIAGAGNRDKDVQAALQEAYENGQLRGNHLLQAHKVIEKRRSLGRSAPVGMGRLDAHTRHIARRQLFQFFAAMFQFYTQLLDGRLGLGQVSGAGQVFEVGG